jgi:hypothetical protein
MSKGSSLKNLEQIEDTKTFLSSSPFLFFKKKVRTFPPDRRQCRGRLYVRMISTAYIVQIHMYDIPIPNNEIRLRKSHLRRTSHIFTESGRLDNGGFMHSLT